MITPSTGFRVAAKLYLESLDGPGKKKLYATVGRRPIRYFGQIHLENVTKAKVRAYRKARWIQGAKDSTVNREVYFIKRVLRQAGLTIELGALKNEIRRCALLTEDDLKRVLAASAERESWRAPAAWAAIAAGTGVWEPRRIEKIAWGDVDPFRETLTVEGWEYQMTAEMREALIALELRRVMGRPLDRIFSKKDDHHRREELLKAAGLPPTKLRDFGAMAPLMIMIELTYNGKFRQANSPNTALAAAS